MTMRFDRATAQASLEGTALAVSAVAKRISEARADDIDDGRRARMFRVLSRTLMELELIRFPEPRRR
jgi:hypothetical protein